ncbi:MAG: glycerol-3-phosphate dehydrogenase/oxidase [Actinomycetota bacterium]|nr:glycerol-3-phosphate dehydrogenase/oxidase [Actinomycetota bacterium]
MSARAHLAAAQDATAVPPALTADAGVRDGGDPRAGDATRLDPAQRRTALERLGSETFDVLVIGGGVTGCGVALDAATRGLSVAQVEMRDFAAGTSSRSGKLIHGGLRYLEQMNFGLVQEALRERALMLRRLCPHLVRPVQFVYPLRHRVWERGYVGAGMLLYDSLGGAGAVPRHRHLGRRAAIRLAPSLREQGLTGALTFYDAQVDDARHTLTLARTAAAYGAVVTAGAKVVGLLRERGRVVGATVRDSESGAELAVRARAVVSATGVWNDEVSALAGATGGVRVRASKGVHIMVPRERIRSEAAILVRAEDSVLFIRPWGRHWLIGTTDTAWKHDLAHPSATRADVGYLLRNANRVVQPALTVDDVVGVFAGLRPLVSADAEVSSRLSREHAVASPAPGLTVVVGGKYTTYRVMAADAVDAALGGDSAPSRRRVAGPRCRTGEVALLGAEGYDASVRSRERLASRLGVPVWQVDRLLGRYGSLVEELAALVTTRPELVRPVPGAAPYLMAEAVYAGTHEGARHLDDVLTRRLHVSIETPDRGLAAAAAVAPALAGVLGWDAERTETEVAAYRARIEVERAAEALPDDAAADAVRRTARDPRV